MISFEELACEILTVIRKKNSTSRMDTLLNLGHGQYQRWESGRVKIKWEDFTHICKKRHFPLGKALQESLGYKGNPFHYDAIVKAASGTSSQENIAKKLDVTRYTVNRWLNQKASPTLVQMLELFHFGTTKLLVFIHELTLSAELSSIKTYVEKTDHSLSLVQDMPWMSGVLCALNLSEYKGLPRHDSRWLAEKLAMSTAEIERTIIALEKHGLIVHSGMHFKVTLDEFNPAVLKERARDLLLYWMQRNTKAITEHYPSPDKKSLSSYHIFAVDRETASDIKKLYVDFTKELSILVNKGMQRPEGLYSFVLSMVDFDEFTKN